MLYYEGNRWKSYKSIEKKYVTQTLLTQYFITILVFWNMSLRIGMVFILHLFVYLIIYGIWFVISAFLEHAFKLHDCKNS